MSDHGPVFHQVNLVVSDMEASVAFYRRLGLRVPDGPPEWRDHHRAIEFPNGQLLELDSVAFVRQWNGGFTVTPGAAMGVLGFNVASRDAVDAIHADLVAAGHASQQAPYDTFWGARYAVVADPDGHAVGIMSPIDPQRRSAPTPP